MENLSIVVREDCVDKIYDYLDILRPLLSDKKTHLVIINNTVNSINIDFNHTIYKYEESYKNFKEFYTTVCLKDNIMLIESGTEISKEVIDDLYIALQSKPCNYIVEYKRFIDKSNNNYYVKKDNLVFNEKEENIIECGFQLNDFRYIDKNEKLENKITKFIEDKRFSELYLWHNLYLKTDVDKLDFYETLEKIKTGYDKDTLRLINNEFVGKDIDIKYSTYLKLQQLCEDLSEDNKLRIMDILNSNNFNIEEKYFAYFLLKVLKEKIYTLSIFRKIEINTLEKFIDFIFTLDENTYMYVYNFITSLDIEKELISKNEYNIQLYMRIIKIYIQRMSIVSVEKIKKEMLIQMFVEYSNYGLYLLKAVVNNPDDYEIKADEIEFLLNLQLAIDSINESNYKKAIEILKLSGEKYPIMTMVSRYYVQKLVYENNLYTNKFSICMMVKNEEKNLRRCLESLKPLISEGLAELIIVDTGSEDRTVEIAYEYTNRVYFHPWRGNFSESRNYTISLALGEYIFIMDADNEIEPAELQKIKDYFKEEEYKEYTRFLINLKNFTDEKYISYSVMAQMLIFKNDGEFYYQGSVHNQPMRTGPWKNLDVTMLHYGYIMTDDIKDKKFIRTSEILLKELQKQPRRIYYRMQLSASYSMHRDAEKALEQVNIYMKDLEGKDEYSEDDLMPLNNATTVFLSNGLHDRSIEVCNKVLASYPDFIDFIYNKATALYYKKNYKETIPCIINYLRLLKEIDDHIILKDHRYIFYSLDCEKKAIKTLLVCYYETEDYNNFFEMVNNLDKEIIKNSLYLIINTFFKFEKYEELSLFYNDKIFNSKDNDLKMYFNYLLISELRTINYNRKDYFYGIFEKQLIDKTYIEAIRCIEKDEEEDDQFFTFINGYELEEVDIVTAKMLIDKILPVLKKCGTDDLSNINEIVSLKKCSFFILDKSLNTKQFSGLSKEELLDILDKYIHFSMYLFNEKHGDYLSNKEVKFIRNIRSSFDSLQEGELLNAVRYIKDGVIEFNEMARPMELFLEAIILQHNADSQDFNSGGNKINNNFKEYSKKVKSEIEALINTNSFEEAKNLIKEYEKIVKEDLDIYSMKSIILILEGNLDEAEKVLFNGLKIDSKNFDLNYNLAYLYQHKGKFLNAIMYYKVALNNCNDNQIKKQIEDSIKNISIKNNINNKVSIKKVLFLQRIPCIRTNKVAKAINEKGIQTDIIYLAAHPAQVYKDIELPYKNIYRLTNINEMVEFINKSDYDIIYSSNEPDYLTVLFMATNKPIVHDTHDMMSLRADISVEQQVLEFIANVKSDGNIYVIPEIKDIAIKKFNIKNKPMFTLNSFIEKDFLPVRFLDKLSNRDGEIHCVFEGGLISIQGHHRYLEPILLELAENNIHIHLHCIADPEYIKQLCNKSKYIHYEGVMSPKDLITEMTKYDLGLAIFNLNERNKTFLDTAFPNKVWDYLAAGLPILFTDLLSFRKFAEQTGVGKILDMHKNIKNQVQEVKNISIEKDILIKNKWIMNEAAEDIINFLVEVKKVHMQKEQRA